MIKRKGQSGNIMTILLAGVAMSATLGFMTFSLLSGPIGTMKRLDSKILAQNQITTISRITLMDATSGSDPLVGDCDTDSFIEPRAGRKPDPAFVTPIGTRVQYVPYAMGAPVTDPWGKDYLYCVWDVGALRAASTCGVSVDRANGSPDPYTGDPATQTVLAVFSGGADGLINSTCSDYVDATTPVFACNASGTDDICQSYTYSQASSSATSFWNLKKSDSSIAETAKKIEIGTGGAMIDTSTGAAEFTAVNTTTGKLVAGGGLMVADDTVQLDADCNAPPHSGKLRYYVSGGTSNEALEICDGTGWVTVGGSSGGGGGLTLQDHWIDDGSGNIFHKNSAMLIGTETPSDFTALGGLEFGNNLSGVYGSKNPGVELFSFCASSPTCDATIDFQHSGGSEAAPSNVANLDDYNIDNYELGRIESLSYDSGQNAFRPSMIIGSYWQANGGRNSASPSSGLNFQATQGSYSESNFFRVTNDWVNDRTGSPVVELSRGPGDGPVPPDANLMIGYLDADLMLDTHTADSEGPSGIYFRRSRGTQASPTSPQDGDHIGGIESEAASADDACCRTIGIHFLINGTSSGQPVTDIVVYNGPNDSDGYPYPTGYEALRVTGGGNIGVNNASPQDSMSINGIFRVTDTGPEAAVTNPTATGPVMYYRPEKNIFRVGNNAAGNYFASTQGMHSWASGGGGASVTGLHSFNHSGAQANVAGKYSYMVHGDSTQTELTGNYSYCMPCGYAANGNRASKVLAHSSFAAGLGLLTMRSAHHSTNFGGRHNTAGAEFLAAPYTYGFGERISMSSGAKGSVAINLNGALEAIVDQPNMMGIYNGKVGIKGTNTSYALWVQGLAYLSTSSSWSNSSDSRLKDVHGPYTRGIDDIAALETVRYHYKKDNALDLPFDKENTGFVAQDVLKTFPEAVKLRDNGYYDVDISPINVAMVNAIKDLNSEQERLKAEQVTLAAEEAQLRARYATLKKEADLEAKKMASNEIPTVWYALLMPFILLIGFSVAKRRRD